MYGSLFERQNKTDIAKISEHGKRVRGQVIPISWRIALLAAALLFNLVANEPLVSMAVFLSAVSLLLVSGARLREVLSKLAIPMGITAFLVLTQLFWYGHTPLFQSSFWGIGVVLYREGLQEGLALGARAIGGFGAVLLFTMTSSFSEIMAFAKKHRVPPVLVELMALVFRFIFVLREDAVRIREAQLLRLGYADFPKTVRSVGILGGKLVIDSFDRAGSVYEAMQLRGYES